jgi:glycosyltransferase involved in cell wall biosynthesis
VLTVIILTFNEQENLPHALDSLSRLGADIWVIDSGSTDGTLAIAREAGCHILEHPFESHSAQINWAIDNIQPRHEWIMRLDADEWITPELCDELQRRLPQLAPDVSGLEIKRRIYFWGKWMKHGGIYPIWMLRIWRAGKARCEDRLMDEHMIVMGGRVERLQSDFADENRKGIGFFVDKHNRYADREVRDILAIASSEAALLHGQAGTKRRLKERYYLRAPLFLRALAYWCYRYFFRAGFMDGVAGCVFHFMQGFWYRMLVDAKLREARSQQR